jgi:hypothetical protein
MALPVGSVTRVESLVVTDTFGVRSLLRPIGDPLLPPAYFSMWQLAALRPAGASEAPPVPNRFFLPPTIVRSLDGGPLEDVLFMRDEMANLAWGIERTIENPIGAALSLSNPPPVASTTTTAPAPAGAPPPPRYTLSAVTPANWVPLMPVQVDAKGTVKLKPAIALQPDGSNRIHTARPGPARRLADGDLRRGNPARRRASDAAAADDPLDRRLHLGVDRLPQRRRPRRGLGRPPLRPS